MRTLSRLVVSLLTTLAIVVVSGPAFAEDSPTPVQAQNWYETVGVPDLVSDSFDFTVISHGQEPVCGMRYGESGDWLLDGAFTFQFTIHKSLQTDDVFVALCNGRTDTVAIPIRMALDVSRTAELVNGGSSVRFTASNVSGADQPFKVLLHGETILTGSLPTGAISTLVEVKLPPRQRYEQNLKVVFPWMTGSLREWKVRTTYGWARFRYMPSPYYTPCSTVSWFYDSTGQPEGSLGVSDDIQAALAFLSTQSGLVFVQAPQSKGSNLVFNWRDMGAEDATIAEADLYRHVTFNTSSSYMLDNSAAESGDPVMSTRAWVVVHEVLHMMGFDHVHDPAQLMYAYIDHPHMGTGDMAGVNALYKPQTCQPAA